MGMFENMIGMGSPVVNVTTVKDRSGKAVGSIRRSQPVKKKKRLQYNFKQISTQILLAKTSGIAGNVAVRARAQVAALLKKKNGDYDDTELNHAIIHARRMARIAKKRQRHLKEEERAKQQGVCSIEEKEMEEVQDTQAQDTEREKQLEQSRRELQKLQQEYQELMQEVMEESLEDLEGIEEELLGAVQVDLSPEELERLKKKHRADELREIMEADMKYLKAMMYKLEQEKQQGSSGVSVQFSGVDMPVQATEQLPVTMEAAPAPDAATVVEGGTIDLCI